MLFLSCPLCSVFCWHCLDVYCTETAIYGTLELKQTPPVNTHCVTDIQSHNHTHASTQYNISCYRTMSAWLTIKTQLQSAILYDAFTCTASAVCYNITRLRSCMQKRIQCHRFLAPPCSTSSKSFSATDPQH